MLASAQPVGLAAGAVVVVGDVGVSGGGCCCCRCCAGGGAGGVVVVVLVVVAVVAAVAAVVPVVALPRLPDAVIASKDRIVCDRHRIDKAATSFVTRACNCVGVQAVHKHFGQQQRKLA